MISEQMVNVSLPNFLSSESPASITCICSPSRLVQMGCILSSTCQEAVPWPAEETRDETNVRRQPSSRAGPTLKLQDSVVDLKGHEYWGPIGVSFSDTNRRVNFPKIILNVAIIDVPHSVVVSAHSGKRYSQTWGNSLEPPARQLIPAGALTPIPR